MCETRAKSHIISGHGCIKEVKRIIMHSMALAIIIKQSICDTLDLYYHHSVIIYIAN